MTQRSLIPSSQRPRNPDDHLEQIGQPVAEPKSNISSSAATSAKWDDPKAPPDKRILSLGEKLQMAGVR